MTAQYNGNHASCMDSDKYRKCTVQENGKTVLYLVLKKALYRLLQAVLLFWQHLMSQLQELGFNANPYDVCLVNQTINSNQCTIAWHVDDLRISHVELSVVITIINMLQEETSKQTPLTVKHGKYMTILG